MSEEEEKESKPLKQILSEMNEQSDAIAQAVAKLNDALKGIDDED